MIDLPDISALSEIKFNPLLFEWVNPAISPKARGIRG
jgi:hypothetical protein